jgi:hypothetical protein
MAHPDSHQPRWRRSLRRELAGLVALKVAALALLWWLFFSPPHRISVDAQAASRHLGVAATQAQPARGKPVRAAAAGSGAAQ